MIEWTERHTYYITSKQGYNVSKSFNGKIWQFGAWPPKPEDRKQIHRCIGIATSEESAKALCEQHRELGERHE